jgi:competence ComEA-like helix-hairpin-helix protein
MSFSSKPNHGGMGIGPAAWANDRPQDRPEKAMRNVFAFVIFGLILLAGAAQAAPEAGGAPLDLNRATADQLETLPGIGAVKAAAILEARDTRGGFESMEELEEVRGIGPALVTKLRPLVVLGSKKAKAGKTAHK